MNYQTEITGNDGARYQLDIRTNGRDKGKGKQDVIYLFITISKRVERRKFPTAAQVIRYTSATHEFKPIGLLEGINAMLYDDIIKRLNETYSRWSG